jgi:hypothetical protein
LRNISNARLAISEWAVIDPPMMIPAIGMIAAPVKSVTRIPKITRSTGTTPAANAATIHPASWRAPTGPEAVSVATTNITPANSNADHVRPRTTPMINETTATREAPTAKARRRTNAMISGTPKTGESDIRLT